jgi:glycosyltransferase involved in cell wall biosynthesis
MSDEADGAPAARPRVTIGLITYHQERFVREAVRGVLAQTYSPLQVVICDDASPDATFDIIGAEVDLYRGPHEIVLQRNERNLGIGNLNQMMRLATGELIVVAHGDDISLPHRVERLCAKWRESGASLVSSNGMLIGEDGREVNFVAQPDAPKLVSLQDLAAHGGTIWAFGGALAWERRVFDVWGPIDPEKSAVSTDWIIPFRAALLGGIAIVDEPLLHARRHRESTSNRFLHSTDELVHKESNLANQIVQYMYMLETLTEGRRRGLVDDATFGPVRERLILSVMRSNASWRLYRNRLLAAGRRAQWVDVKG